MVVTVTGLPVCGSMFAKPIVEPCGMVGSSRRTLSGTPKGSLRSIGRMATMMSSSGFIRTVSFQPSSFASGGWIAPSQPTRLITCTLNRWKWIGMGVHAVVRDLPDLRPIAQIADRRHLVLGVSVEDLGDGIDVPCRGSSSGSGHW